MTSDMENDIAYDIIYYYYYFLFGGVLSSHPGT